MDSIKKQQRNEAVDIFRVICAFLVIIGHTRLFMNINSNLDFFLTNVLLRIAVPFFFIVSGYFFYSNMKINNNYYKGYIKKIIISYVPWQVIYVVLDLIRNRNYINTRYIYESIKYSIFGGTESYLWFFSALIFSTLFITFFIKKNRFKELIIISIFLLILGLLGNSYYFIARGRSFQYLIDLYNHIFSCTRNGVAMAAPYMVMGILLNKYKKKQERRNYYILALPLILVIMISETLILGNIFNSKIYDFYISQFLFAPIIFLMVDNINIKLKLNSKFLRNFSLNLYYCHVIIIMLFRCLKITYSSSIIKTIIIIITSIIISILLSVKVEKKKIFSINR